MPVEAARILAEGGLPVALMAVNGGVRVIMSAVLVASLPLLAIAVLMCVNLTVV